MKTVRSMIVMMVLAFAQSVSGQTDAFDIATFVPPKGWTRTEAPGFVSFSRHQNAEWPAQQLPDLRFRE